MLMRRIALSFELLAALVICLSATKATSQWVRMNGPYGWEFDMFTANDSAILATGTSRPIYRSTDGGLHWAESGNGIWNVEITALGTCKQAFLAGASDGTNTLLFLSSDNGANWEQVNTISPTESITCFASNDSGLFAGTYGDGVYVSKDGGLNWSKPANTGLEHSVVALLTVGSNVFAGTYGGGVYESTDECASWTRLTVPNYNTFVTTIFMHNGKLFMESVPNLYSSNDFGSTWSLVNANLPTAYGGGTVVEAGSALYFASDQGVFISSDDGASWTNIGLTDAYVEALQVYGNNLIAGSRNVGIFTSRDGGNSWLQTGAVNNMMVQSILSSDSTLIVGDGAQEGVFISRDYGNTYWEYDNMNHSGILCMKMIGTDIYAGTAPADTSGGGVFKTSDYGKTWQRIGLKNIGVCAVAMSGSYLFAASPTGIFRTSNGGATWTVTGAALPNSSQSSLAEFNASIFAGTTGGVFKTTDNGASWPSWGLRDTAVFALTSTGTALLAGTQYGVFRNVPPDTIWYLVGFPDTTVSFLVANDTMILAGTGNQIFLSKSNGTRWASIGGGMGSASVSAFAIGKDYLFAGSWDEGVWRRPMSEILTGIKDEKNTLPDRFTLEQNYPNPFNPSTVISYRLPENGFVVLKVYDILGREVRTLVNGLQTAGTHSVTFDAGNLSTGVYFFSIRSGIHKDTKKLLLLK